MALEVRITGPGLDVVRLLQPGAAPLVLGRDADCDVCLPDPERNVSRRHLSICNQANELHVQVLSVINGAEGPDGEPIAPGSEANVSPGQALKLAAYRLTVAHAPGDESTVPDPWAILEQQASGLAPLAGASREAAAAQHASSPAGEDDPFGDWGFETTFGPGAPGAGGLRAGELGVASDISAFYRGLGVDPAKFALLSTGELEAVGRMVRVAVLGLLELQAQTFRDKHDVGADDPTMLAPKERNPLGGSWPDHTKLQYLFGGRATCAGFAPPERAVREIVGELLAHQQATAQASRLALEKLLADFEPSALKARLLAETPKLFGSAKAWEAYVRHYEERAKEPGGWVQYVLDGYFVETYLGEFLRVKRDTAARLR